MSDGFQPPPDITPTGPTVPPTSLNDPNQTPAFDVVPWADPSTMTTAQFIISRGIRVTALFAAFAFIPVSAGILMQVPVWKACVMAGLAGFSIACTFLLTNIAKTGRVTRRDIDVALAMAANDLPNRQYQLGTSYNYQPPYGQQ